MKKIVLLIFILLNSVVNAQEEKTVTLTVSGTGKTIEEARLNALRSAVEQAFGAFISSKTEILNDNLVKDEIVSVASGNVHKYDVISQMEIPNMGGYAITLSAIVSIDKLTSFAESKGVTVEFKGGVFAANIKLQKLNEQSEIDAVYNIYGLMHEKFQTIFDYSLEAKNPVLNSDQINYNIPISVIARANKNYYESITYLFETLKSLSLNESEVLDYENLKKTVYKINLTFDDIKYNINIRNRTSFKLIKKLAMSWSFYIGNFKVENGVNTIDGPGGYKFHGSDSEIHLYPHPLQPFIEGFQFGNWIENGEKIGDWQMFGNGKIYKSNIFSSEFSQNSEITKFSLNMPSANSIVAKFDWNDVKSLNEIEKITAYSVRSAGIISKFSNGGYVIYEKDGHGIIASPFYYNTKNNWGNTSNNLLNTEQKLYSGKINTEKISKTSNNNIGLEINKFNISGYNDWVIPSSDELELLLNKLYSKGILFEEGKAKFISSTETNKDFYFGYGLKSYILKDYLVKLTENNINNKFFSFKNIINNPYYNRSAYPYQNEENAIHPIRYF